TPMTDIDGGPVIGAMLNVHFFPGIKDYDSGNYNAAHEQMSYVIKRPSYLEANPRQAEYMSVAHYLRGMIYVYHAEGLGRYSLAKADFEQSIKWNANNYVAYLELSRVYSALGLKGPAAAVLDGMKKFDLDEKLAKDVEAGLSKLNGLAAPS